MIRSFVKLEAMRQLDRELSLIRAVPDRVGGREEWSLYPTGQRIHGNTAKAARRRGFPDAQTELFDGGLS